MSYEELLRVGSGVFCMQRTSSVIVLGPNCWGPGAKPCTVSPVAALGTTTAISVDVSGISTWPVSYTANPCCHPCSVTELCPLRPSCVLIYQGADQLSAAASICSLPSHMSGIRNMQASVQYASLLPTFHLRKWAVLHAKWKIIKPSKPNEAFPLESLDVTY